MRTIAQVAVDNEKYFGELDAVVGDGDFGYSMARGFELVLQDWDGFDRADIGTFLKKVAVVITSRIGGTSGPIWGRRSCARVRPPGLRTRLEPAQVVAMLRASIEGIKARGKSDVGDKTLLDALVPAVDTIEEQIGAGHDAATKCGRPRPPHGSAPRRHGPCRPCAGGLATRASGASAPWTRAPSPSP